MLVIAEHGILLHVDCVRYDTLAADNELKKSIDDEGVMMLPRVEERKRQKEQ